MGNGASVKVHMDRLKRNQTTSYEVRKFVECFAGYCSKDKTSRALRGPAWRSIDNNGNGYVSLAEAGAWIKQTLLDYMPWNPDFCDALYEKFYPSYIRSFKDAADAGKDREIPGVDASTDDYLQKGEFRIFCAYLCAYAVMYDAFNKIDCVDGDEERKFEKAAWDAAYSSFVGSPLVALNACATSPSLAEAAYSEMDADGKGAVLLIEFCSWIKNKEIQMGTELGNTLNLGD